MVSSSLKKKPKHHECKNSAMAKPRTPGEGEGGGGCWVVQKEKRKERVSGKVWLAKRASGTPRLS